jgi:hypothetical protein
MRNFTPLDEVQRIFNRISREFNYWTYRFSRIRGGSGIRQPETEGRPAPVALLVIGGCILLCLCVTAIGVLGGIIYYLSQVR